MDILLVVDMQAGLFLPETPRHDAAGVISRINQLAAQMRARGNPVIFIQHDGNPGEVLAVGSAGWQLHPSLQCQPEDRIVRKSASDAFYRTGLKQLLRELGAERLLICGCATDFCVDTTIRAAVSHGFPVIAVADAHTTCDRPHLDAPAIIEHHHFMWQNLIMPANAVQVVDSATLLRGDV